MALVLCGHPRSGTTLLMDLCDRHPEVRVTFELGCFLFLGETYHEYRRRMLRRWWRRKYKAFLRPNYEGYVESGFDVLRSLLLLVRYMSSLRRQEMSFVRAVHVETSLKDVFPAVTVVGDKYPGYVFELDDLTRDANSECLVIYRDGRDVISSTLNAVRTIWSGRRWVKHINTPAKVAERWVRAVAVMERNAGKCHMIRYEDFVRRPKPVMEALGSWLDIDPTGFPVHVVRESSVGKHRSGLTPEELSAVVQIAGPTLERLGYEI